MRTTRARYRRTAASVGFRARRSAQARRRRLSRGSEPGRAGLPTVAVALGYVDARPGRVEQHVVALLGQLGEPHLDLADGAAEGPPARPLPRCRVGQAQPGRGRPSRDGRRRDRRRCAPRPGSGSCGGPPGTPSRSPPSGRWPCAPGPAAPWPRRWPGSRPGRGPRCAGPPAQRWRRRASTSSPGSHAGQHERCRATHPASGRASAFETHRVTVVVGSRSSSGSCTPPHHGS